MVANVGTVVITPTGLLVDGGWYAGADTLSTNQFEPFSAAEYDWKQAYVPCVWTGLQKLKNQGDLARR